MRKSLGTFLVVAGLLLAGWGLIEQTEDNKTLKIGGFEFKQDRGENISWMIISGGASLLLGIMVISINGRHKQHPYF